VTFFKFDDTNIIRSTLKTHPDNSFFIYLGKTYYNNNSLEPGTYGNVINHYDVDGSDDRSESLYEYNVDRNAAAHNPPTVETVIYPYITKSSDGNSIRGVSTIGYDFGDDMIGSYPLLSNISQDFYVPSTDATYDTVSAYDPAGTENYDSKRRRVKSLRNVLNYYKRFNPLYAYDYDDKYIRLISVPEVFYGSNIKKGSVELNIYYDGVVVGTLTDTNADGILYQSNGQVSTEDGDVAGLVLYSEGVIALTGDWSVTTSTDKYRADRNDAALTTFKWFNFGVEDSTVTNTMFDIKFQGSLDINVLQMLAPVDGKDINFSNNPTYTDKVNTSRSYVKSDYEFVEEGNLQIKNTVKSEYDNIEEEFGPQVFVNKIGVYDENKRLIGVAELAKPVKVNPQRKLLFKIKVDY